MAISGSMVEWISGVSQVIYMKNGYVQVKLRFQSSHSTTPSSQVPSQLTAYGDASTSFLMKASACEPYLLTYCWCELASLPLQQYGSVESQYDWMMDGSAGEHLKPLGRAEN